MRWTKILNAELLGVINRYSGYQQYPLTIEQFTSFGKVQYTNIYSNQ